MRGIRVVSVKRNVKILAFVKSTNFILQKYLRDKLAKTYIQKIILWLFGSESKILGIAQLFVSKEAVCKGVLKKNIGGVW